MMELHLYRKDLNQVRLVVKLEIEPRDNQNFTFKLAEGFRIEKILDQKGKELDYDLLEKVEEAFFAADTNRYEVKNVSGSELEIHYSGSSTGQHTMISQDVISLNYCSAWYPHKVSCDLKDRQVTVYIYEPSDCKVMEASFDRENERWVIENNRLGQEIFIISFSNYRQMENDLAAIYYYGEKNDQLARKLIDSLPEIKDYFTELFGEFDMEPVDIFSLPIDFNYGGYNYKGNLIYDRFILDFDTEETRIYDDIKERHGIVKNLVYGLGHELAHNRCQGAESNWEAWLNETTADWAIFSYLIDQGEEEFVKDYIDLYIDFEEDEKIRTDNGKRPNQYHNKGPILFFKIYKKYGLDLIKKMIRAFVDLDHKTTDNWLAALKDLSPSLSELVNTCLSLERIGDLEL